MPFFLFPPSLDDTIPNIPISNIHATILFWQKWQTFFLFWQTFTLFQRLFTWVYCQIMVKNMFLHLNGGKNATLTANLAVEIIVCIFRKDFVPLQTK